MTKGLRRIGGCGLGIVLAIILIISLVAWSLSFLDKPSPFRQLDPVPHDLPPIGGAEVPAIDVEAPGRTADKLSWWSDQLKDATSIPEQALRAYGNAELIASKTWPDCNLRWNTLAGIGWVETRHGSYNGNIFKRSSLDENGYPDPPIVGIPLDGSNNTTLVPDSDGGTIDGDVEFDRAVGPMQFIATSWEHLGRDANGDGVADPNQIDDAALGAAALLCFGNRDLSTPEGWREAILNYNQSEEYVRKVAGAANSYAIEQPATS
ncbi:lytic transglycosylase domain-containing protein [Corynebacterium singulare]|uniref:Transglycosylase SLT domain-containing protein n=1 Tax=Corynebacterium singulare TaxID=161899 RepID=A0A0B6EUN7_9CORY|nr:hypothetical protein [Corynebacterium singulare]AJI78533.1 hypothetical protein CSING_04965 [Corynebacterium singulare]